MQRDAVEILEVGLCRPYHLQLLLGIIYERAELTYLALAHRRAEQFGHLAFDIARGILEQVAESLVLAMQVGHKMLCAFWQVEYGLEIYYLGACCADIRKGL